MNQEKSNSNIWISSDWHLNHSNIAGKEVSKWNGGYRNFKSTYDMNEEIIKTINKYVKWDDELWFLGDFCFGGHKLTPRWRERINCQTFNVIRGNHDGHIDEYKDSFTSIQDYWEGQLGSHHFVLCHYAFRVWLGSHKGYLHCYGHSHSTLEKHPNGRSMDVGIDNAYKLTGEYKPFNINEVVSILMKREIAFNDGHNSETNVR